MTKSWSEWVNENISRNCDPVGIARILLDNSFTVPAIKSMMGDKFPDHFSQESVTVTSAKESEIRSAAALPTKKMDSVREIRRELFHLNPECRTIERRANLSRDEFLAQYYSANRPVVIQGLMEQWQAPTRWTPEYLKQVCGDETVEIMASRDSNALYEIEDAPHRKNVTFSEFIDMVNNSGETNDYYLTARNNFFSRPGAKRLLADIEPLPVYLRDDNPGDGMYLWYGPKGTITPLHHDTMNIFMAQIQGRKKVHLIPAEELDLMYNHYSVYSEVNLMKRITTNFRYSGGRR